MKKVLVTGATGGIGYSIAKHFKNNGYKVFVTGRNCEKLMKIEQEFDFSYCCDLSKQNELENLVKSVGDVDILVNNAGEYLWAPIEKTSPENVEELTKINFIAPYLLTSALIPNMKKNHFGRIINIGSISGSVGEANATLYSSTKSALIGMTKSLALEVAENNITVNIINPGWVDTNLTHNALDAEEVKETLDMIPQRRFIEPAEIASLALYLASEEARGLTGQYINLCAGLSIG